MALSLICQLISTDNDSIMFLMLCFIFISPLGLVIHRICRGSSFIGLCYKSGHSHSIIFGVWTIFLYSEYLKY